MNQLKAQLSLERFKASVLLVGVQIIAFNFSLTSSLRLTLFVILLIWSGSKLIERISKHPLTPMEQCSTGFVTGIALLLSIDFLVTRLEFSHWISLLILFFAGYFFQTNRKGYLQIPDEVDSRTSPSSLLISFSIALLTFNLRALWAIPIAASLLVWAISKSNRKMYSVLFLLLGLAFLLHYGKTWQLATSNDAGFYESLSWSIIEFGQTDHPGFAGGFSQGPLSAYHTAAYSFSGLASFFSGLEPYEFINQFGPLVNSFVLATCLLTFLRKRDLGFGIAITAILVTFILPSGNYNSWSFSLVILFVFAKINFDVHETRSLSKMRLVQIIPIFMIGMLTIFSKGTMLLPVLAVTASSIAFQVSKREVTKDSFRTVAVYTTLIACFIFFAWWKFLRVDTGLGGGISTGSSLWSSSQDIGFYQTFLSHRFRSFTLLSAFAVLGLNIFLIKRSKSNKLPFDFWLIISLFASLFLFVAFIPSDFRVDEYVGSAHLGLMIVFTCLRSYLFLSDTEARSGLLNRASYFTVVISIFVYVPIYRLIIIPRSGDLWEFLTSISPATKVLYFLITENLWLSVLVFSSLIAILFQFINIILQKPSSFAIMIPVLVPLLACLSLRADNVTDFFRSGTNLNKSFFISPDGSNSAPNPTGDLLALGNFVRQNTPSNSIFASNNFCCAGDTWFESILDEPSYTGESALGGANYLLPASLQRRFLIQGPRFQINCCINQFPDHIKRMRLSLQFANNPSTAILNELKQYSVEFFVVNKLLTDFSDWRDFSTTIYENDEFILLRI
jgi:hypothetical protein